MIRHLVFYARIWGVEGDHFIIYLFIFLNRLTSPLFKDSEGKFVKGCTQNFSSLHVKCALSWHFVLLAISRNYNNRAKRITFVDFVTFIYCATVCFLIVPDKLMMPCLNWRQPVGVGETNSQPDHLAVSFVVKDVRRRQTIDAIGCRKTKQYPPTSLFFFYLPATQSSQRVLGWLDSGTSPCYHLLLILLLQLKVEEVVAWLFVVARPWEENRK